VLLMPRSVVELSFGWLARFRRLAYGRLPETIAGLHPLAFVMISVHRSIAIAFLPELMHDTPYNEALAFLARGGALQLV
jgi:hypothetical protein